MTEEPEVTELFDADIDRVDLVGHAANGRKFLIAKSTPIIPADTVRALLKEGTTVSEENTPEAVEAEVVKTSDEEQQPETDAADAPVAEVVKADTSALLAVYDANGRLCGVVDPSAVTPVSAPVAEDAGDDMAEEADVAEEALAEEAADVEADAADDGSDSGDGDTGAGSDGGFAEEADAMAEAAVNPTEADGANQVDGHDYGTDDDDDSRTIPGTSTVQSPAVRKTAAETDVTALLKEHLTQIAEELRKSASLAEKVEVLEEQVRKFGALPDDRNLPHFNGANGSNAGVAARDTAASDPLEPLRKAVAAAQESGDRAAIEKAAADLRFESIKARFNH